MGAPSRPDVYLAPWAAPREEDRKPVFVLLITGSRWATEPEHCKAMDRALNGVVAKYPPSKWRLVMVHGAAPGADSYCATWARSSPYFAEVWSFPAEWDRHAPPPGSRRANPAGPIRNEEMVHHVASERSLGARVGCVAFPDENAVYLKQAGKEHRSGTLHCVERAEAAGINVLPIKLRVKARKSAS